MVRSHRRNCGRLLRLGLQGGCNRLAEGDDAGGHCNRSAQHVGRRVGYESSEGTGHRVSMDWSSSAFDGIFADALLHLALARANAKACH